MARPPGIIKPESHGKRSSWTAFFVHRIWRQEPVGWGVLKEVTYANKSQACTAETRLTALSHSTQISQGLFIKRPGVFSCLLATLQLAQA